MISLILTKDVFRLGEEGDVVDVKNGYARNYLLPQGYAILKNKHNLEILKQKQAKIEKRRQEKREESKSLKERLEGKELEISMPSGDKGKLFGAVNTAVIAKHLHEAYSIDIEKKKIEIPEGHIKFTGTYSINIRLYEKTTATIKVTVKELIED